MVIKENKKEHPEIGAVLSENKNSLMLLHDAFGIDFNKPLLTDTLNGVFTARKILLSLQKKYNITLDPEQYTVAILFKVAKGTKYSTWLNVCNIGDGVFNYNNITYTAASRTGRWGKEILDSFFKKQFNEKRANSEVAYVFAQKKDYISIPARKIDVSDRVKIVSATTYACGEREAIRGFVLKQNGVTVPVSTAEIMEIDFYEEIKLGTCVHNYIDRSGYIINKKDLRARVAQLRAEKEKRAVDQLDLSHNINYIVGEFDKVEVQAKQKFSTAKTCKEYEDFFNLFGNDFPYIIKGIEEIKEKNKKKEFKSINEEQKAIVEIYNRILTLEKAIASSEGEVKNE